MKTGTRKAWLDLAVFLLILSILIAFASPGADKGILFTRLGLLALASAVILWRFWRVRHDPERAKRWASNLPPRVAFRLDGLNSRRAQKEFARMLQQHLSITFGPIRFVRQFPFAASVLVLTVDGDEFYVGVRYVPRDRESYIAIHFLPSIPKDEERKVTRHLMRICDEINALLINMPAVTRLRWYLEGWDVKKPAVRTPGELPWKLDVPELNGSESRSVL